MARKYGMGLAPWGALGQGKFKTPEQLASMSTLRGNTPPTAAEVAASRALAEVAEEIGDGATLTGVAAAWTRAKMAYCVPIIGGSRIEHLRQNAKDLAISLTPAQVAKLDAAAPFDHGFPNGRFGRDPHYLPDGKPESLFLNTAGDLKFVTGP
jgi:aryl-alcohol dehydrogenase-like predicted oxidoreductase